MTGVVLGLHVNPEGGVPKHPVQTLSVHKEGCAGDKQNDRKHHGGPEKAVSILEAHVLEALQRQGHPIMPGSTGENVLLGGRNRAIWELERSLFSVRFAFPSRATLLPARPSGHRLKRVTSIS